MDQHVMQVQKLCVSKVLVARLANEIDVIIFGRNHLFKLFANSLILTLIFHVIEILISGSFVDVVHVHLKQNLLAKRHVAQ